MAATGDNSKMLFVKEGMQKYKGDYYLGYTPPAIAQAIEKFEMFPEDILFATYPKSGTHFLAELLWLVNNNADIAASRKTYQGLRMRFLEHEIGDFNPVKHYEEMERPRLIKTHFDSSFFEKSIEDTKVKVVVMVRDPRDMLVALYGTYSMDPGYVGYKGSWDEFFEIFKAKQLFGGDWFKHTQSWLKYKDMDNVMMLRYEDVLKDPEGHITDIARFCEKELTSAQIKTIAERVTSGEKDVKEEDQGVWKDYFTPEQVIYFDHLYKQNMANSDIEFLQ